MSSSTRTPSPESAAVMARLMAAASVPRKLSSRPAATTTCGTGPSMARTAKATAALASSTECPTTTSPITAPAPSNDG